MVLELQAPPNASLLAPFSASFSTPFLAPSKNNFLSLQSHPGEPTSARIDSSGAHFGNLEPNSKKGGPRNGPPNRGNDLIFNFTQWPFLAFFLLSFLDRDTSISLNLLPA